jgi:hypothetical protein
MTRNQAIHIAGMFSDYFSKFDDITEYMREQKIESLEDYYTASLPGMGPEDDLFSDFTMSPEDMNLKVHVTPKQVWTTYLDIISTHINQHSVPGRNLFLGVKETNTDKWVGFIRLGSPVINMKPRHDLLGQQFTQTEELARAFNKTSIMGFVIVPAQPFGFNYIGGKLLAGLCCSHEVRELLNKKYGMNTCFFETTSLYGSSKQASQYDGMKPFLRFKGLTDSDFVPMMHGKSFDALKDYIKSIRNEPLVEPGASSWKLKFTLKVIGMVKSELKGTSEGNFFNGVIEAAKSLTERKRYYVSNYGIQNYIDIAIGKTDKIVKADNFDRFYQENIIEWWKKKATKRFNNLKEDGRLRTEMEVWTRNQKIDILR